MCARVCGTIPGIDILVSTTIYNHCLENNHCNDTIMFDYWIRLSDPHLLLSLPNRVRGSDDDCLLGGPWEPVARALPSLPGNPKKPTTSEPISPNY